MKPLIICLIPVFATCVASADEPTAYQWSRPIQFEADQRDELVSVPLESDVYRATQDGLSDVRILSSDQQFVPFLIRKQTVQRDRVERRRWKARDVDLKPLKEGALEIRVKLRKDDPQPEGLTLSTPLRNFEQRVQVFEGEDTDPLVSDAVVYDYSQYMDVSRRDIRLPKNSARSFRIVVGALTAEQETQLLELTRQLRGGEEEERQERTTIKRRPFRIDRIDFFAHSVHRMVPQEASISRPVVEMKSETDSDRDSNEP